MLEPRKRFAVCLMVNHACNLRCTYCYIGAKFHSAMAWQTGVAAINRGFNSLVPGGELELGFFGGEPMLECGRIAKWMQYAKEMAGRIGKSVTFNLTTNGTITHSEAWHIIMDPDLALAVSFDGCPGTHDRHRRDTRRNGTATAVEATLRRLLEQGREFRVVVVVRPDSLSELGDGLEYLHRLGVRAVDLSLDLWTTWTAGDGVRLRRAIEQAAQLWRKWLPGFSLNWFDCKLAELARMPTTHASTRCGFGAGEIAVAPSGRLYPCERVIGEDRETHPLRLPGDVRQGNDFLEYNPPVFARHGVCAGCSLDSSCDTTCRCSNYIRTGDANRPDGLLCILNKATTEAVARMVVPGNLLAQPSLPRQFPATKPCYA